jgi:hypothetical protein
VSCNTYIKALNAFCLWAHTEGPGLSPTKRRRSALGVNWSSFARRGLAFVVIDHILATRESTRPSGLLARPRPRTLDAGFSLGD